MAARAVSQQYGSHTKANCDTRAISQGAPARLRGRLCLPPCMGRLGRGERGGFGRLPLRMRDARVRVRQRGLSGEPGVLGLLRCGPRCERRENTEKERETKKESERERRAEGSLSNRDTATHAHKPSASKREGGRQLDIERNRVEEWENASITRV
eukprot:COSAG05_NODE_385_length_10486_cov_12.944835_11_plen_155_part_00